MRLKKASSRVDKTYSPLFISEGHSSSHVTDLPLAANTDKDNKDGDHKGRRCCDGSQEQQVFVSSFLDICPSIRLHDTHSLSLTHSLPLELKLCHTDCLLRKTCRDASGGRKRRKKKDAIFE